MNENVLVELSDQQREVLLRGLRYVKSSARLTVYDPTPESVEKRDNQIKEIEFLVDHLNAAPTQGAAASV
jgi:hypothetical protein